MYKRKTRNWHHAALTVALTSCLATLAQAQSVTGSIFGQVPAGPDTVVVIRNLGTGASRTLPVDATGRYRATDLPDGHYRVSVQRGGAEISARDDVAVNIASGTEVSFTGAAAVQQLDRIEVHAAAIPVIDVSQTDVRTVFTAAELQRISVGRSINRVALLAPGVNSSTSYSGLGSFGGSAASENAYYINGFPVTNPLTAVGYTSLGFDAIAQEQVLTGGYGAEYGRSTGGVVNIVTKRGSNTFKGGVYTIWSPKSLQSSPKNLHYADTGYWNRQHHYDSRAGNDPTNWTDGTLYGYRNKNQSDDFTYGLYASGPIISDRLFFYANAERERTEGGSVQNSRIGNLSASSAEQGWDDYHSKYPRWTAKLDWNLTDDQLLEFTGVQDNGKYDNAYYGFDYDGFRHDDVLAKSTHSEDRSHLYIGKYTAHLSDALTLSALYGRQKIDHIPDAMAGYDPTLAYVGIGPTQVPDQYAEISNPQKYGTITDPGRDQTRGYRFDIGYRLGRHELRVGLDRFRAESYRGSRIAGPGYWWSYGLQNDPDQSIDPDLGVGAPSAAGGFGPQGYYVSRNFQTNAGAVKTEQSAWYLEDRWQLTDTLLLSLGLRNDGFKNYNGDGRVYVRQDDNWAPRLGFAWDVLGDSTLKVFGNVGRYHLALPNNVAIRAANRSLISTQYFTYTGIAADGTPQGLVPVPARDVGYTCPNGGVSNNLECGNAKDPRTVAAAGLKAHYQDEYLVGLEQQLTTAFSWGAKLTYRTLRSAIDDTCTPVLNGGCFIFNPGRAATFWEEQEDGSLAPVHYSNQDLGGFPKLKRKYAALDLFAQYQAGPLYGRVVYTLSHNWGNAEGQLDSSTDGGGGGQGDVSATEDWDLPHLMVGANGPLPNNRTHNLKLIGYYELSQQWRVGGSFTATSGRPRSCTTYWPESVSGDYNISQYYYGCGIPGNGSTVPASAGYGFAARGSHGETPWVTTLNANVAYTPDWADHRLTVQLDVFNLLDTQTATLYYDFVADSRTTFSQSYGRILGYTEPRSARITVRYDF